MKTTKLGSLAVLLAVFVLVGCTTKSPANQTPSQVTNATPETSTVAQLQSEWTLINFGAPW